MSNFYIYLGASPWFKEYALHSGGFPCWLPPMSRRAWKTSSDVITSRSGNIERSDVREGQGDEAPVISHSLSHLRNQVQPSVKSRRHFQCTGDLFLYSGDGYQHPVFMIRSSELVSLRCKCSFLLRGPKFLYQNFEKVIRVYKCYLKQVGHRKADRSEKNR